MTTRAPTTRILAFGEPWEVPRGFGRLYSNIVSEHQRLLARGRPGIVIGQIRDMLLLIGYEASVEAVAEWPARKRVEAYVYALNVHMRASDNPIHAHPRPTWMPEPWCAGVPDGGEGIWASPRGTFLP